ncbi:A disintegrin and metallopeptidase domain 3 isoform X2 [Oryctolagus cuniculus]|uniref:A disintegrin and metallopeptidase domain 3 isoform X2 n=1 Tax=Oryctolagus cuniculus TaxID=9986 RepID=UPI0038797D58
MLCLLFIFSGLGPIASAAPSSEMPLLYLTVPQRVGETSSDDYSSETNVTYLLKIKEETFTILLKRQSFLHPHFLVYSYNKSKSRYSDTSLLKVHCFYQGHVAEIPKSSVILSTCSGLRGLLQFDNVTYGIEPLESSVTNEHILYQIIMNETGYTSLQEIQPVTQYVQQSYKILVQSDQDSDIVLPKRTLKIHIIVDKAMYDFMGSDGALAAEKIVHMFGVINAIFSKVRIAVILSSLELWSDENKISTNGNAEEILQRFLSWKQKLLSQSPQEMSYLLIYRDQATFVGATYHGRPCDPKFAAGVAMYAKMITFEAFSIVMVQFIGINLGLSYDNIYHCYCPGTTCIMNPEAILSSGVKFFSSCSMAELKQAVSQPEFECLLDTKVSSVVFQGKTGTCGNGILEGREQCDCGKPETCIYKKCCNPHACELIGFAECGTGPCCNNKTCLIAHRGLSCRKSTDPCDFPEYCNGTSEICVPDIKAADLEPCQNKTAYCYKGRCRDLDRQCADFLGVYARGSTYLCGQEINFLHDQFGGCRGRFCTFTNTLCGHLVCTWTSETIIQSREFDYQYTFLGGHVCVSGRARNRTNEGIFVVEEGTTCGRDSICIGVNCKHFSQLPNKPQCNARVKCNGHGICNERLNCHCDPGFAPPNCERVAFSPGGSTDDGFWLPASLLLKWSYQQWLDKAKSRSQDLPCGWQRLKLLGQFQLPSQAHWQRAG